MSDAVGTPSAGAVVTPRQLPLPRAAGWIALFSVREMIRRRRLLATGLVGLVPVLLVLAWRLLDGGRTVSAELLLADLGGMLYVHFGVVVAALAFGLTAIGETVDDGTILYYWTRPVSRAAIYTGRLVAAQLVAALLVVASLAACFIVFTAGNWQLLTPSFIGLYLRTCLVIVLGAWAYTAVFVCLGTALRRPLLAAMLYGFVWESIGGNTPLRLQELTVAFHLRNLIRNPAPEAGGIPNLLERLRQAVLHQEPPSAWQSLLTLAAIVAVSYLAGCWLLRRKELFR